MDLKYNKDYQHIFALQAPVIPQSNQVDYFQKDLQTNSKLPKSNSSNGNQKSTIDEPNNWERNPRSYCYVMEHITLAFAKDALQLAQVHDGRDKMLIDIACGSGGFALYANNLGFDVLATDLSRTMLELVKEREPQISTMLVDGQTLEGIEDNSFDFVTSVFGIVIFPDRQAGWKAAHRVLKQTGTFVCVAPDMTRDHDILSVMSNLPYFFPNEKKPIPYQNGANYKEIIPVFKFESNVDSLLRKELEEAGFHDIKIYPTVHSIILENKEKLLEKYLGNAVNMGDIFYSLSEQEQQKCKKYYFISLGLDKVEGPIVVPAYSYIAIAKK